MNLSNRSVFKTLEKSLQEFINQTRWTDIKVRENERLRCSFTLVITKFENTRYEATLLVQSSRPVYNSAYQSPIFNLQDKKYLLNIKNLHHFHLMKVLLSLILLQ